MLKTREPEGSAEKKHPADSEVNEALRLILESQPFRTSKQCQDLLRYLVGHSLRGDDSDLRERIVGTEVFGRKPSYDTNDDPVVRVRAADVRKRLAQYYQSQESGLYALHIELQPGSYRAHFRYAAPPPASMAVAVEETHLPAIDLPPTGGAKNRWLFSWRRKIAAIVLIAVVLSGAVGLVAWNRSTPQERFWAPMINAKQPVLIYLGANAAYVLSSDFLAKYRAAHGMLNNGPEFFVDMPPGSSIKAEDLVAEKDTFVTTADVSAIVQLTTLLRDWKRPFVLRTGNDLSFGDLRNRPSVMIGAFNNQWTIQLTDGLPFSFRRGVQIFNRDHPERSWSVPIDTHSGTTDDYALITRLLSSKTGGPSITVAGVGECGTLAAAEFLANPDKMRDLLKTAPRGWDGKNMQAVLSVKVVDYQPVAVEVIATAYW